MTVYVFQWAYVKPTGAQGHTYETTIETYPNAPRSAPSWVGFYFTVRNDHFYGDDDTNLTVVFWDANSCENGTCHNEADKILSNTIDFFPVSGGGLHSSVESFTSYAEYKNQSSNGQYVLFGRNWGPYPSSKISLDVSISKQPPNSKPRRSTVFGVTEITGCYLHIYWNAVSGLPQVTYRVDYAPEGHFGADRKNISLTVKDVKASLSLHGAAKQVLVHIRAVREGTAGEPLIAKISRLTDTCSSRTLSPHSGAFSSLRSTPVPTLQPAGISGIVSTSNQITVSPSPMTTTVNIQTSFGAEIRLSEIQASTISLTHIPTTPTPALKCWTDWFNIDNPGWTGDYEKLDTLRRSGYKVCKQPDAVRCRTVQTHIDAKLTGRKLTCSPSVGFFCVNSDQDWGKTCLDYEVKFLCPCDYVDAPTKPPFDLRLGCWTAWLDRDGPGGTGDYEQRNLFSRPICDRPGAVQCRRASNHQEALKTGQNLFCSPAMGLNLLH
ncbi:uncharacterized protein [Oscarella lobularis]|uniref:uncharacterized protein n=1 Tax=Oscarella lobularis TaxID=121494 RepID=UPI003313B081